MMTPIPRARLAAVALLAMMVACRSLAPGPPTARAARSGPNASAAAPSRQAVIAEAAALSALGRQLFVDTSLSGSGALSCASCHDPARAFGPPNALATQPGGRDLETRGRRAAPSLMYLQDVPPFSAHRFDAEETNDDSIDQGPAGGLTWDGRVDQLRDQARVPLLSPDEMANGLPADVVASASRAGYAEAMRALGGPDIFQRPDAAFDLIGRALAAYQRDPVFAPFSSKYDDVLAGRDTLTADEARGLALFNDPDKGNCARCHPSARSTRGLPPLFTDFGFAALGVPRNTSLPANQDPTYFDMGLCGPLRADYRDRPQYCGLFRTPTLRNVATRQAFFHNGVVRSLEQAVAFYATRDSSPERWYPRRPGGTIAVFDDLPPAYAANVDREAPFGRRAGAPPALADDEVRAIVSFLRTLTDRAGPAPGR